jgi:hypothetical protein
MMKQTFNGFQAFGQCFGDSMIIKQELAEGQTNRKTVVFIDLHLELNTNILFCMKPP